MMVLVYIPLFFMLITLFFGCLAVVSKKEGKGVVGAKVLGFGGETEGSISKEVVNRIKI